MGRLMGLYQQYSTSILDKGPSMDPLWNFSEIGQKTNIICSKNPSCRVAASATHIMGINRVLCSFQHPARPHDAFDEDVWVATAILVLPASTIWVLGKVDSTTSKAVSSTPEPLSLDLVGSVFTGCMVQCQSHP